MAHWKKLLPESEYIGPQDFDKGPVKLTITKVVRQKLTAREDEQGAVMYLETNGKPCKKRFHVCKSLLFGLAQTFGSDSESWHGQEVELYKAKCLSFGQVEECVRIRFTPEVDRAIIAWLKKLKVSPRVYLDKD